MKNRNGKRRKNRKNRIGDLWGGTLTSVLPILFFVFDKNEISVQNECVATTESVVK